MVKRNSLKLKFIISNMKLLMNFCLPIQLYRDSWVELKLSSVV